MCGICGFAGFGNNDLLKKMNDSIAHRGPDAEGTLVDEKNKIYLGHRRLSIIDLFLGNQPMLNEDGAIAVVFNGEIYNYQELKKGLVTKGHIFKTSSDTEVLLHLYEEYSYTMVDYLNGIFSYIIYDKKKKLLFGVRDYFGIKPFYYYYKNGKFLFASEIKAILCSSEVERRIDLESLHYFINLRYLPGERTLFKNIYKLCAGNYLIYELKSSQLRIKRYWNKQYTVNNTMSENEAIEGIRHYLKQAIKRQLVSDVPVGAYLSGGLDSSAVVAYASQNVNGINTFSMGFNEPTDEIDDAHRVSDYFKTDFNHTFIKVNPLEFLKEVLWHVEEPKVNMLQGYFLSQYVRKYVKVVLSGLGGDELFAGYVNNQILYPFEFMHSIIPNNKLFDNLSNLVFKLGNTIGNLKYDEYRRGLQMLFSCGNKEKFYLTLRNVWDYDNGFYSNIYSDDVKNEMLKFRTKELFEKYFEDKKKSIVEQSLYAEFNTKMIDDFLLNEDRTSMAHGIEVRVPFLDKDLVEFAFSIPYKMKIKNNVTKSIFKKSMKGILPDFVLAKKKWGFAINPYYQFKKDLKKTAIEILNEKDIKEQGIFNYRYIEKIIHHPVSPRLRWHYYYLLQLIGFQYWYNMFIENK